MKRTFSTIPFFFASILFSQSSLSSVDDLISASADLGVTSFTGSGAAGAFAGDLTGFALVNIFHLSSKGSSAKTIETDLNTISTDLKQIKTQLNTIETTISQDFNTILTASQYKTYTTNKDYIGTLWSEYTGFIKSLKGKGKSKGKGHFGTVPTEEEMRSFACSVTNIGNLPSAFNALKAIDSTLISHDSPKTDLITLVSLTLANNKADKTHSSTIKESAYYKELKKHLLKWNVPRLKATIMLIEADLILASIITRYTPINKNSKKSISICEGGYKVEPKGASKKKNFGDISKIKDICTDMSKNSNQPPIGNPAAHCDKIPQHLNIYYYGHESLTEVEPSSGNKGKGFVNQLDQVGTAIGNENLIALWHPSSSDPSLQKGEGLLFPIGSYTNKTGSNIYTGNYPSLSELIRRDGGGSVRKLEITYPPVKNTLKAPYKGFENYRFVNNDDYKFLILANDNNLLKTAESLWTSSRPPTFNMYLWPSTQGNGYLETQSWWNNTPSARNMGLTYYYQLTGEEPGLWNVNSPGGVHGNPPTITPATTATGSNGRAVFPTNVLDDEAVSLTFDATQIDVPLQLNPGVDVSYIPFVPVIDASGNNCKTNAAGWLMPCQDGWVYSHYSNLPTVPDLKTFASDWSDAMLGQKTGGSK